LRFLQAAIRRTEDRLQVFEAQYGMASAEFLRRYENDELQETLEFDEWIGEYRVRERLLEKADTYGCPLKAIRVVWSPNAPTQDSGMARSSGVAESWLIGQNPLEWTAMRRYLTEHPHCGLRHTSDRYVIRWMLAPQSHNP
jgi:hypothetical protein